MRRPLRALDIELKRSMDLGLASVAIVALLPVFALIAIAIKIDSRGDVLFVTAPLRLQPGAVPHFQVPVDERRGRRRSVRQSAGAMHGSRASAKF